MKKTNYKQYISKNKDLVGMIHLRALPGTPKYEGNLNKVIDKALEEAKVYKKHRFNTVMIENMHDVPYTKKIRPEITSAMSVIGSKVKELSLYCGIQILAGGNIEALAAAKAAGLDFIRAEGYVFSHIGDEGLFDSCAGELLRYRKAIDAEDVLVFTDIKKKHSSHAITSDISVYETAKAAEFFGSDGVIITGNTTGEQPEIDDLKAIKNIRIRKIIGSGIDDKNIETFKSYADIFIVGSYFKRDGDWRNELDEKRIKKLNDKFRKL